MSWICLLISPLDESVRLVDFMSIEPLPAHFVLFGYTKSKQYGKMQIFK